MTKCPLCHNRAAQRFRLAHTVVWSCMSSGCRLQFAFPQLEDDALARAYEEHYYPTNDSGAANVYENTPDEVLRQALDRARSTLGPLKGKSMLDFGCGVGRLCRIAQQAGIRTTGIEADLSARRTASMVTGMKVFGNLDELRIAQPQARFDVITLWDVVEHLREPWKDLSELLPLLEPDGCLLLSTPNARSLRSIVKRERWEDRANPTHLYYFSRQSLRLTLQRSGYDRIVEWRLPIRYPKHRVLQRMVHRALAKCRIQGQLVFVARPGESGLAGIGRNSEMASLCPTA